MKTISLRQLITAVVIIGISFGYARADKQELLTTLNQDIQIDLRDVPINLVLEKIKEQRQIDIVLSDEAIWKLPSGENTKISVKLDGILSEALEEMLNAFFMRYAVGNDQIVIYPKPELEHIIGRPDTEQLELLRKIYTMKFSFDQEFPVDQAHAFISETLGDVSFLPYNMPNTINKLLSVMGNNQKIPPTSIAILFEQAGEVSKMSCWYISKIDSSNPSHVINFAREDEFRDVKINQVVDISYQDEEAGVILKELAFMAGMELEIEKRDSDWLEETITVEILNTRLRQVFENITKSLNGNINFSSKTIFIGQDLNRNTTLLPITAGSAGRTTGRTTAQTGGTIGTRGTATEGRIPEDPVAVLPTPTTRGRTGAAPRTTTTTPTVRPGTSSTGTTRRPFATTVATGSASSSEGYVGKISIPMDGGSYFIEFMLRESDLTEPLRELRAEKIKQVIEKLETEQTTNIIETEK